MIINHIAKHDDKNDEGYLTYCGKRTRSNNDYFLWVYINPGKWKYVDTEARVRSLNWCEDCKQAPALVLDSLVEVTLGISIH